MWSTWRATILGEIERVACETQRRNPKVSAEDTATMLVKHKSGVVSIVECTYESKKLPDPFPETLVEIEGPRGVIVTKPGYHMEVTVDGKMTASEFDIPMLHWAKKPWHMIEESVYKTCAHLLAALKAGRDGGYFGAGQSEDLCGVRSGVRIDGDRPGGHAGPSVGASAKS